VDLNFQIGPSRPWGKPCLPSPERSSPAIH
jgi:hypothetical protein